MAGIRDAFVEHLETNSKIVRVAAKAGFLHLVSMRNPAPL
jgi:hypothetical protein